MPAVFNRYELAGDDIAVTYSPDGEGPLTTEGAIVFTYAAAGATARTFRRSQVHINHDTPIGDLITVRLTPVVPDTGSITFTLVLPTAIRNAGTPEDPKADITALGITTVHQGNFVGPEDEKYTAAELAGTASRVIVPLLAEASS